jgi:hypothetical protein
MVSPMQNQVQPAGFSPQQNYSQPHPQQGQQVYASPPVQQALPHQQHQTTSAVFELN